jgi:CDGSH-type Zn-finger protein
MSAEPISIVFKKKGTIIVEGAAIVRDEDGNEVPQPPAKHAGIVKLCGCGKSETKPFCDGSHKQQPAAAQP